MNQANTLSTQKSGLSFNPFGIFGVTDYKQFKEFPFLESNSIRRLKNQTKNQIRDNFRFAERTLLLGEPGIGKTTALYYAYDILNEIEESKRPLIFLFHRFFTDADDFQFEMGITISEASKKPMYILVDFPDTINAINFKKFLDYCWTLMTSENYQNINFIFACNISHYSRSLSLSEILNKFNKFRIDRLEEKECRDLIKYRLLMAESDNYFEDEVYEVIFKYSRGIPRNIICASKVLVDEFIDAHSVSARDARILLKEEFIDKIINDREEHPKKRIIYKEMMKIITNDFNGTATNQSDLVNYLKEKVNIGKNKSMGLLSDLHKFGLLEFYKGGKNNSEKIWSVKI